MSHITNKLLHISKQFPTFHPTVLRRKWKTANADVLPGTIVHIDPDDPDYWKLGIGTKRHIPYIVIRDTAGHETKRNRTDVVAKGYENRGGADNVPAYCLAECSLFKSPTIVEGLDLPPGTLLTSPLEGSANAGYPTEGTYGTHTIIGQVVSNDDGPKIYGDTLLSFVSFVNFGSNA